MEKPQIKRMIEEIEKHPISEQEHLFRALDSAVVFGVETSALASLLNAGPVVLYTRNNPETGIVECIHPSAPEPIFEDARNVLARMAAECDLADALKCGGSLN